MEEVTPIEDANPELAALGWMILNPYSFDKFQKSIKTETFAYKPAQLIFTMLSSEWERHRELPNFSEAQMLIKRLASHHNIVGAVQAATLRDLGEVYDGEWTASSGDILKGLVGESIVRNISENYSDKPGSVLLSELPHIKDQIISLEHSSNLEDDIGIFPFSSTAFDNPEEYLQKLYKGTPVPTGLSRVDMDLGGGVSPGEVALVMAPFNTGKSMLLLNMAFHAWVNGYRVVYYALDNLDVDMVTRLWTRAAGIVFNRDNSQKLVDKVKQNVDWEPLQERFILKKLPAQRATVHTLERHIDNIALRYRDQDLAEGRDPEVAGNPHLCIIDYADKLSCHERLATDKRTAITYIYQGIISLAETKHMATWTASQTNRDGWEESFQKSRNVSDASTKMEEVAHAFGLGRSPTDTRMGQAFLTCHKARRHGMKHKIYPLRVDDARAKIEDNPEREVSWETGMDGSQQMSGGGNTHQSGNYSGGRGTPVPRERMKRKIIRRSSKGSTNDD